MLGNAENRLPPHAAADVTASRGQKPDPMSSPSPEEHSNPEQTLTPAESADLTRLEGVAQVGVGTYLQVGTALAEIRDRHLYRAGHPSFEAYVRERWADHIPRGDLLPQAPVSGDGHATPAAEPAPSAALHPTPCEALAEACKETMAALEGSDRLDLEIHLAVRKQGEAGAAEDPSEIVEALGNELLPTMRWLMAKASGTLGLIAYQLESRAADIDDDERARLRDDVLVLEDELVTVKALLAGLVDWDAEFGRLLDDELPPSDSDIEPHDD